MPKPVRHDSHILETESNKFFINQIPNEWIVDKPEHDYGVDYNVNIAINNEVTGLSFSAQLKSKKKDKDSDFTIIKLKHTTLSLYNTMLAPVLLVAYIQEEEEAYWCWYNDLNIDLTKQQKTFSIKILKTNKLSQTNWGEIVKYVQSIFSIKTLVDGIKSLEYDEISNSELLAWRYYYSSDYENAIFYFKNLLRNNPDNVTVLEGLSQSQYETFNYKEALFNINKAIELSGEQNQYLTKACILAEDGIQNRIKGKILEARNIFKQFLRSGSNQALYHYNYANTLSQLGQYQEAIEHYKKCLKINPNQAGAWKNLGQVYWDIHEHEKEMECYNKALAINPKLPQALFSKGTTLSRVYEEYEEALKLMFEALEYEEEMIHNYAYGYFEIAYAYEKLNKINDSLIWINKGLDFYPEDLYYLNFKSNLLIEHWKENEWLKEDAIRFFEFRLELENDYKSLYALLTIRELDDEEEILNQVKKHTTLLKDTTIDVLKKCGLKIKEHIVFLLHYDKYLNFRKDYPIHRYLHHLISDLFVISTKFLEVIDLIFATSFSDTISEYFRSKNSEIITQKILAGLILSPNTIKELIPDDDYSQEEAISLMSHIYLGFPTIIVRELGAQTGMITGTLGLEKPGEADTLPQPWYDDLCEQTLLTINRKLKLLRED
jgi:tetratricopeptide (TPR) repeat protein